MSVGGVAVDEEEVGAAREEVKVVVVMGESETAG